MRSWQLLLCRLISAMGLKALINTLRDQRGASPRACISLSLSLSLCVCVCVCVSVCVLHILPGCKARAPGAPAPQAQPAGVRPTARRTVGYRPCLSEPPVTTQIACQYRIMVHSTAIHDNQLSSILISTSVRQRHARTKATAPIVCTNTMQAAAVCCTRGCLSWLKRVTSYRSGSLSCS